MLKWLERVGDMVFDPRTLMLVFYGYFGFALAQTDMAAPDKLTVGLALVLPGVFGYLAGRARQ
jgi:hypothetical protein